MGKLSDIYHKGLR